MLLDWYRQLIHRTMHGPKFQAISRHRRLAARGPCFHRLLLESLEARLTPAVHTWIGQGTVPNWSSPFNWSGGVPAGDAAAQLVFANTNWNGGFNDIGGLAVNRMEFVTRTGVGSSWYISGNAITMRGNTTITVDDDHSNFLNEVSIHLTLDQEVFCIGMGCYFDHVFNVPSNTTLGIDGQITGNPFFNGVHKTGMGLLELQNNANDYGGGRKSIPAN